MSKISTEAGQRYALSGPTMATEFSAVFHADVGASTARLHAALVAALEAVEDQMSHWREGSDINRLNRAAPGEWVDLPANLMAVLAKGLEIGAASGGAFDMALGDLVSAWGFGPPVRKLDAATIRALTGKPRLPCAQALELAPGRARRLAAVRFDLSGIAKGFGADEMARVLQAQGIADFLVGIDGELRASGRKPGGAPWTVAVETPTYEAPGVARVVELHDCAIASSGDYRNWAQVGTSRVSHTMHPVAARPVQNGVAAASVLAPTCMEADAWATALMVLGPEAASELARTRQLDALLQIREAAGIRPVTVGRFA